VTGERSLNGPPFAAHTPWITRTRTLGPSERVTHTAHSATTSPRIFFLEKESVSHAPPPRTGNGERFLVATTPRTHGATDGPRLAEQRAFPRRHRATHHRATDSLRVKGVRSAVVSREGMHAGSIARRESVARASQAVGAQEQGTP
jgi:hypothetical protein